MSDETTKLTSIKFWAEDDRPREKMILRGRIALSDSELLAILIATGTRTESAITLAKKVLQLSENNLNELGKLGIAELCKIKGIGHAKAITLMAALELGRRRSQTEVKQFIQITCSRDSFNHLEPLVADLPYETFWVLLLNRNNRIIRSHRISEGGISGTVVDTRLIFKMAIENLASGMVLCHNHPSGNTGPSDADIQLTRKIRDAGKLLDIGVIDHIIIGDRQYFSFADEGLL